MFLTKNDFLAARTCPTKLYYKKLRYPSLLDDDPYMEFLADGGYDLSPFFDPPASLGLNNITQPWQTGTPSLVASTCALCVVDTCCICAASVHSSPALRSKFGTIRHRALPGGRCR